MSQLSSNPPLYAIIECNGCRYQTIPKSDEIPEMKLMNGSFWIITTEDDIYFAIHLQTWCQSNILFSERKQEYIYQCLQKYFDLFPFEGNEPPIYYVTPFNVQPPSLDCQYQVQKLNRKITDILGIEPPSTDEEFADYMFQPKLTEPYQFGKLRNGKEYGWITTLGNWTLNPLMGGQYYTKLDFYQKDDWRSYSLGSLTCATDEHYDHLLERIRRVPWDMLFDICKK